MRHVHCALIAFALSLTTSGFAQESSPSSPAVSNPYSTSSFEQLRDATQLDRKDAPPFHLRIDLQLYDLKGKPSRTGTIEEWWVSPNEYRIETNSGSLHYVTATGQSNVAPHPDRDSYLLSELWQKTVRPLADLHPLVAPTESKQTVGNAQLDCFTMSPLADANFDPSQPAPMYCTDPGDHRLRLVRHGFQLLVRNSLGNFQGTEVALSSSILYLGRPAISGKISLLQSFTPGSAGSPALETSAPAAEVKSTASAAGPAGKVTLIAGRVAAGRILERTNPSYPPGARAAHITGSVLLHAVITKEGRIGSLFVIASPDESLSGAAMDAVRTWKYAPYLLSGKPVEVDTTITVNFTMNTF